VVAWAKAAAAAATAAAAFSGEIALLADTSAKSTGEDECYLRC